MPEITPCYMCNGVGGWEDPINQMTYVCPVCKPIEASHQPFATGTVQKIHPTIKEIITHTPMSIHVGGFFAHPPHTIILHSPAYGESAANYLVDPPDGEIKSCHICWKDGRWYQLVHFNTVAWHCKSKDGRMNQCSIGIERHGPSGRMPSEMEFLDIASIIKMIQGVIPTAVNILGHYQVNPNRTDPGFDVPKFVEEYLK